MCTKCAVAVLDRVVGQKILLDLAVGVRGQEAKFAAELHAARGTGARASASRS